MFEIDKIFMFGLETPFLHAPRKGVYYIFSLLALPSSCTCFQPSTLLAYFLKMSIGVPIKVLHEAEGHVVTCETASGEVYRGKLIEAEDNMNSQVQYIMAYVYAN